MNKSSRSDLGGWIRGRLRNGVEAKTAAANTELAQGGISMDNLRQEWQAQRAAQLSIRQRRLFILQRLRYRLTLSYW